MAVKAAKVPVIMQMEAVECGAACLAMVLAFHGKWLSLEQVRESCGVSRDGSSAKNIVRAARQYGLRASGYRMEIEQLKKCAFPVILHWEFNHFVVLCGFKKNKAVLNDPARGTVLVDMEDLDGSFTGIVLCFEPDSSFEKSGKPASTVSFAKKRLAGSGGLIVFIMLWSAVNAAVAIVIPFFAKVFMDNILPGKNPEWLSMLVFAMLGVLAFQFVAEAMQSIYWLKVQGKMAVQASSSFMWHVLRLPVAFFAQRYLGDIANRQSSNESIAATLIGKIAPVGVGICLLVLYACIMFRYSVVLSVVGMLAVVINLAAMRITSARRVSASRVIERDLGQLAGITTAGLDMIESIKAAGAENGYFERWSGSHAKAYNGMVELEKANQYYNMIPQLVQQTTNAAVLMLGVYLIMEGTFTIGMLLAFQGFLLSFMAPVNEVTGIGQMFIEMRSQMERVEDVFQYQPDVPQEGVGCGREEKRLRGSIEMRHIDFGYSKLEEPLIRDFSLHVPAGGSVAFVGASGSGKSTLAKLISGLYPPWAGEILFDDQPRGDIDRAVLVGSVAVVDQDIVLFEDTVENNVTMWNDAIPQADVIAACKAAEIHEDIVHRPEGYSYTIKEGGKNFSGGQRQRLEIARALANRPTVLILDEATSALDAKTEEEVMLHLKARGITLVVIAHRLSTIRDCDEIIVLEGGVVRERGTHEDLIAKNGKYAELIEN